MTGVCENSLIQSAERKSLCFLSVFSSAKISTETGITYLVVRTVLYCTDINVFIYFATPHI